MLLVYKSEFKLVEKSLHMCYVDRVYLDVDIPFHEVVLEVLAAVNFNHLVRDKSNEVLVLVQVNVLTCCQQRAGFVGRESLEVGSKKSDLALRANESPPFGKRLDLRDFLYHR